MAESPKFLHHIGNRGRRTRSWRQILTESRNKTVLRMRNKKYAIWPLVMAESPKLLHSSAMDLWTRLWGRYHVPQNVFLVVQMFSIRRKLLGCRAKMSFILPLLKVIKFHAAGTFRRKYGISVALRKSVGGAIIRSWVPFSPGHNCIAT